MRPELLRLIVQADERYRHSQREPITLDTELFRQFMDNEGFRRWMGDVVFGLTYDPAIAGRGGTIA